MAREADAGPDFAALEAALSAPSFRAPTLAGRLAGSSSSSTSNSSVSVSAHGDATNAGDAAQSLKQLRALVAHLDARLRSTVDTYHEPLLEHIGALRPLQAQLEAASDGIVALTETVQKARMELARPFLKAAGDDSGKVVDTDKSVAVVSPLAELKARAAEIRSLQAECDLLRRIQHVMRLSHRLMGHLSCGAPSDSGDQISSSCAPEELSSAARCVVELRELIQEDQAGEFARVDMVAAELRKVSRASDAVEAGCAQLFDRGLDAQNTADITAALDVFAHLGIVHTVISRLIARQNKSMASAIRAVHQLSVDHQQRRARQSVAAAKTGTPVRSRVAGTDALTVEQDFREQLWNAVESLVDELQNSTMRVWLVQRALLRLSADCYHPATVAEAKTQGAFSSGSTSCLYLVVRRLLGNELSGQSLLEFFWRGCTARIAMQLEAAAKASPLVENALVAEFPKLLRSFHELLRRLEAQYEARADGFDFGSPITTEDDSSSAPGIVSLADQELFLQSVSWFRQQFLSRAFARLAEHAQQLFVSGEQSPSSIPTPEAVQQFVALLGRHLHVARTLQPRRMAAGEGTTVAADLARGAAKALQLFAVRAESAAVAGRDAGAFQVSSMPPLVQQQNAALFRALTACIASVRTHVGADDELSGFSNTSQGTSLSAVVQHIRDVASQIIDPLMDEACDTIEKILGGMHNELQQAEHDADGSRSGLKYIKQASRIANRLVTVIIPEYLGTTTAAASTALASSIQQRHKRSQSGGRNFHLGSTADAEAAAWLGPGLLRVARHSLKVFVFHCAAARPLDNSQRMQLVSDATQLEHGLCQPLMSLWVPDSIDSSADLIWSTARASAALGTPYDRLRAMRALLVRTPREIADSVTALATATTDAHAGRGDVATLLRERRVAAPEVMSLPPAAVLLSLFAHDDGRVGEEASPDAPTLHSPHQQRGWSPYQLVRWLMRHCGRDALTLVRQTLQNYERSCNEDGAKQYSPLLPFVSRALDAYCSVVSVDL